MRKFLNTLYISRENMYLGCEGQTITIKQEGSKIAQLPVHNFESIVVMNYVGVSPALMRLCLDEGVAISFLTPYGRLQGRVVGKTKGNVLLRREQYRIADDVERSLEYAKLMMIGKVSNQRKILQRSLRDYPDQDDFESMESAGLRLKDSLMSIKNVVDYQELLGIEGDTSRTYFDVFTNLIRHQKEEFEFDGRNRRPPLDRVNAMLSFSYGLLRVLTENALEMVGLDSYVGFYHKDRPGRTGLALDMMEELRPYLADRFVVNLINRHEIKSDDFWIKENGAVLFTDDGSKKFLSKWQDHLFTKLKHPFIEETIPKGLLPYVQAQLMARRIREELELYPPFFVE